MRLQLRRKHPHASEEELARRFFEWLKGPDEEEPGFRRVDWPRS